jgi:hypothetical protein
LLKSTLATCLIAEFGFLGDMVTTLVTMPFTWGQFLSIGVLEPEELEYFGPGFKPISFFLNDCFSVANYIFA